jgi:Flp pilus assembly protein TadD
VLLVTATLCLGPTLSMASGGTQSTGPQERHAPVTFAADIAPIVLDKCAACHRPGGPAPFSLLTYADVRPRARQIVDAVTRRDMPPWAPEPRFGDFSGTRRLTDEQVAVFEGWIADGAQPGDLSLLPSAPGFKDGWQLGAPDLVVKLPLAYRLPPGGRDRLRNFVIPISIPERRYVRAWQFRTSNLQVVHHAMMLVDSTGVSRARDEADPEPGYEGLLPLSARMPDGYFVDWTPGQTPYVAPGGMAWSLEKGSDLVLVLHLRPTDMWETVDASVGLYFSDAPRTRTPTMVRLSRQDIDIAAGEPRYTITDSYTLPVDVEALDIKPHAHYLAREMKAYAELPNGTKTWLIYIKSWDFHWQDSYRYTTPVVLPAGTRVTMEYTYDNSLANRANPNRPPRRVTFGQDASNEMGDLWIQVLPRDPADLARLNSSMAAKMLPQDIVGYETMLRADPDNLTLHEDLAGLYLEAGDFADAAKQSAEAIRLKPDNAAAHYSLGYDLLQLGQFGQALPHLRQALALDPGYMTARYALGLALWASGSRAEALDTFREAVRLARSNAGAHYNLAVMLERDGQVEEARASYEKAVELDESFADAHLALGLLRARRGEGARAADSFRRALSLRHDWPAAQIQLAWLLATSPDASVRDPKAATALAERSVALTGEQDTGALDALAAALAADGQFDRAVVTAERVLTLLGSRGDPKVVAAAGRRLALYRSRTAYVEEP